jgi:thiamine monophosphate synthase
MLILPYTAQTDPARTVWVAERALQGGVNWVMLRVRELPARLALDVALEVRRLTQAYDAWLSVNPYPALAEWAGSGRAAPARSRAALHPARPDVAGQVGA